MGSRKSDTEPMLRALLAPGALESDTLPDRADDAPHDAPTSSGPPPFQIGAKEAEAPRDEGVEDLLKNMKPARVWSPEPALRAASEGADFAAFHAVHEAAKKQLTPANAPPVVVAEITPAPPSGDATVLDLGSAIERAQVQERALVGGAGAERGNATVQRSDRTAARRRRLAAFIMTTAAVVGLGLLVVLRFGGAGDRAPAGPASSFAQQATPRTAASSVGLPPPDVAAASESAATSKPQPAASPASAPSPVRAPPTTRAPTGPSQPAATPKETANESGHSAPAVRPAASQAPVPEPRPTAPASIPDHVRGI